MSYYSSKLFHLNRNYELFKFPLKFWCVVVFSFVFNPQVTKNMVVHIDSAVLLTFVVMCLLAILSFLLALFYVIKALRGLQKSLFFLLLTDSLTSIAGLDSMKQIEIFNLCQFILGILRNITYAQGQCYTT